MSVLHCEVILDNPKNVYEPGDKLTGRVILTLDVRLLLKAIFMEYSGFADVQWQISKKAKKQKNNKSEVEENSTERGLSEQRLEVYANREDFLSTINYFVGSEEAIPRIIESGTYIYPFTVTLPEKCPSSFESPNGYIRYMIEVFIDYKNKRELWFTQKLSVLKPLDLRHAPQIAEQSCEMCVEENIFFKIFKEPMQMLVSLQQIGFVPGETVSIHISIHNPNKLKIHELNYELRRISRITASHGHKKTKTKYFQTILTKAVHNFCGARELMMQHLHTLFMPQTVPSTDPADCRCLQITYELNVRLCTANAKHWLAAKIPLIVGTVSLQCGEVRQTLPEDRWQQKLSSRSMDDLSKSRLAAEAYGSNISSRRESHSDDRYAIGATAPPLETRERSMSMMSLVSSSFREAEYMPKTKFVAQSNKTKHNKGDVDFKPKYLYYDIDNAPMEQDVECVDQINATAPDSDQIEGTTLVNNPYAGVMQQLTREMQSRKTTYISDE